MKFSQKISPKCCAARNNILLNSGERMAKYRVTK